MNPKYHSITFHHILINQHTKAHSPPLGVLSLIATLKRYGKNARLEQYVHIRGQTLSPDDLAKKIINTAGYPAISTMVNGLPLVILALRIVSKLCPQKKVIIGGPGLNEISEHIIALSDNIELVCYGEGERQILFIQDYLDGKIRINEVPGIAYRKEKKILKTLAAERVLNIDTLPNPSFDEVNLSEYKNFPIMSSRGCPLKCSFCDVSPSWGRKNTHRSPLSVANEIKASVEKYNIKEFGFVDDLFTLNKRWVIDFCNELIKMRLNVKWKANSHINFCNKEMISLMAKAGCSSVFMGVESGSDETLKKIQKYFTVEKALNKITELSDKIDIHTNLIWGFPFETLEDINKTINLQNKLESMGVNSELIMLSPLAAAPLTKEGYKLTYNRTSENIFIKDYNELDVKYISDFDDLVKSNSIAFSAFYIFEDHLYHKKIEMLESNRLIKSLLKEKSNQPWERV